MPDRSNQVVLVTGVATEVGLATAIHLSRVGYRVFGATREPLSSGKTDLDFEDIRLDVCDLVSVTDGVGRFCK